jgi:hypothetical protein
MQILTLALTDELVELPTRGLCLNRCVAKVLLNPHGPDARFTLSADRGEIEVERIDIVRRRSQQSLAPEMYRRTGAVAWLHSKSCLDQVFRQVVIYSEALAVPTDWRTTGVKPRLAHDGEYVGVRTADDYAGFNVFAEETVQSRRAWRSITPRLLRQVAEIVNANPGNHTKAVQAQMHTSHRNATRWIKAAKDRGILMEGD